MKRKGFQETSDGKKRGQQFLSNSQFHGPHRLYFDLNIKQWKIVKGVRRTSAPVKVKVSSLFHVVNCCNEKQCCISFQY